MGNSSSPGTAAAWWSQEIVNRDEPSGTPHDRMEPEAPFPSDDHQQQHCLPRSGMMSHDEGIDAKQFYRAMPTRDCPTAWSSAWMETRRTARWMRSAGHHRGDHGEVGHCHHEQRVWWTRISPASSKESGIACEQFISTSTPYGRLMGCPPLEPW